MKNTFSLLARSMKPGLLTVTFFASLVLLLEMVAFHVLDYIYDYFAATMVISLAVLGVGLGAFAAAKIRLPQRLLFVLCCAGTTACIYLAAVTVVWCYPHFWLSAVFLAACFFFPVLYISTVFKNHRCDHVYVYDMLGACAGVLGTVLLYRLLPSETIILLLAVAVPLVGLIACLAPTKRLKHRTPLAAVLGLLMAVGGFCLCGQWAQDCFNVYGLIGGLKRETPGGDRSKIFARAARRKLLRSYDTLLGRIDVQLQRPGRYGVAWNGYGNDHFTNQQTYEYETCYKPRGVRWPARDRRVLYGLVPEPKVFILGSGAEGITKTVKAITPLKNITAAEINPAILRIMTKDFAAQSGGAYRGLRPQLGNALSLLKAAPDKFDIITMINTHSTRTIAYQGPPDYLHTAESYHLYFDRLSDKGYILFEERPVNRAGELALYRMIATLWHCLEQRGIQDPSRHFVIWEWMGNQGPIRKNRDDYYVSMIVTRQPVVAQARKDVLSWVVNCAWRSRSLRVSYLRDFAETEEYAQLFGMLRSGDFTPLAAESFDPSPATNNRPFLQMATTSSPALSRLVIPTGIVTFVLWGLFAAAVSRGRNKAKAWLLNGYNVLIGFGYFLIEIVLLQTYQNVFISPAATLVLVLGLLLVSSAVGGLFSQRLGARLTTLLLIPISLAAIYAPGAMLTAGAPLLATKLLCTSLVAATGFLMGIYFPQGLLTASQHGLKEKIPHLFAINSVAGSFAVVLTLLLGVKVGYQVTVGLAVGCYVLASAILTLARHRPEPAQQEPKVFFWRYRASPSRPLARQASRQTVPAQ